MMRKFIGVLAAVAAVGVMGCGDKSAPETGSTGGDKPVVTGEGKKIKVGLVFDNGGRGDKSFNDAAYAGLERAQKELGVEPKTVDSKSEKDYETNLDSMAQAGCEVVFAVGFSQKKALEVVSKKYPNVKFGIIDDVLEAPNVRSLVFSEEQGSFLAGYLGALVSKTGKLGFVGGVEGPLITKFETGYAAGIAYAGKGELLPVKYTGSWSDTALGKAAAETLFSGGADIVYHAAGRCGIGVISAAAQAKKFAIGVDSDQDGEAPGNVLTSMIKRVDEAVYQTISDAKAGKFTGDTKRYDLKLKGVGLSQFKFTKDIIGADNLKKVEDVTKKIESGELVVPATKADFETFKATLKK
jgi:basic membrane protein A